MDRLIIFSVIISVGSAQRGWGMRPGPTSMQDSFQQHQMNIPSSPMSMSSRGWNLPTQQRQNIPSVQLVDYPFTVEFIDRRKHPAPPHLIDYPFKVEYVDRRNPRHSQNSPNSWGQPSSPSSSSVRANQVY